MLTKAMLEKENAALRRQIAALEKRLPSRTQVEHPRKKERLTHPRTVRPSETLFHNLLETNPDSTFIIDQTTGAILFANPAASRLYGYSNAELLRMNMRDLSAEQEKSVTAVRAGVKFVPARIHRRKDGTVFQVEITGSYFSQGKRHLHTGFIRDITERQQAESALREQQSRLTTILENAGATIWALDTNYRLTIANSQYFQSTLAALGHTIQVGDILPPAWLPDSVRAEWRSKYDRVFAGEFMREEIEVAGARGEKLYREYTFNPVRNAAHQVIGAVCFGWDITERKRAEEKLRENEQFFRFIANNSPDVIFAQDRDLRYTWLVNPVSQIPLDQVLGKTDLELFPPEQARPLTALKQQIMQTGEGQRIEVELDLEGVQRWHDAIYQPTRDPAGQVIGIAGYARDITDRKRAEEKLRQSEEKFFHLFHSSPAAMIVTRIRDGKIIDVNETFLRLFGYQRAQAVGHTSIELNMLSPTERHKLIRAQIESGGLQNAELVAQSKSGAPIHLLFSSKPLELDGETCHITTMIDITERQRSEQERENLWREVNKGREQMRILSRQLMDAQENERRNLARELHDEIGQALTAVKINLQTMQRHAVAPAEPALLETSLGTIEKTLQQVRQLSLDLHPSLLDDLGLVPALRWHMDRQTQGTGIRTHLLAENLTTPLPAEIQLVCFRVAQEALTNVLRHARASQVLVELSEHATELDLVVRDDGAGFDVAAMRARALHGETLGLLGMQERVELAGGYLDIESAPGYGTEIQVHLPLGGKEKMLERRSEPR